MSKKQIVQEIERELDKADYFKNKAERYLKQRQFVLENVRKLRRRLKNG